MPRLTPTHCDRVAAIPSRPNETNHTAETTVVVVVVVLVVVTIVASIVVVGTTVVGTGLAVVTTATSGTSNSIDLLTEVDWLPKEKTNTTNVAAAKANFMTGDTSRFANDQTVRAGNLHTVSLSIYPS